MKKQLFTNTAVLVVLTFAGFGSAYAQSDSAACNNRLIAGNYGFTVQGTLSQIDTVTIDGEVVADWTHPRATGTYSVNSDCTGTFTIDFKDQRPTVVANFVVTANGDEIDTVVISAGGDQGILATGSIGKRRFSKR